MSLIAKFSTVGGATMASRVLGFVREMLIAAVLGAGPVADAFYAAFRFPNLFRRLFAEGAFNSAFVPMFAEELETGGRRAAREFAQSILSVLLLVLLVLTALAELAMPFLVGTVIAPSFADNATKFDLTVELTRIMFPYLICMSLVAMLSGVLNAFRRYFLAAFAPVMLNVVLIGVLVAALTSGADPFAIGRLLAWGVFAAGAAQLGLLVYGIRRHGFAISLRWPKMTPKVRKLLVLAAPVAVTGGLTQINLLIGQIIASAQDGAIAILNYADRIYQLPLGVVGIGIGVVLLPELTRALAAHKEGGDPAEAAALQNRALEFALALTLPAAVGLFMMPALIINVLYERGAFDSQTTAMTAAALAAFAVGLPSFVLQKVFQPGYFARFDMRTPMWFAAISVAVNVGVSLTLFPIYGHVGIAIATSVAGWVNAVALFIGLKLKGDWPLGFATVRRIALMGLACIAMAGAIYAGLAWSQSWLLDQAFMARLAWVAGLIAVAMVVYFAVALACGALDRAELAAAISRRRNA